MAKKAVAKKTTKRPSRRQLVSQLAKEAAAVVDSDKMRQLLLAELAHQLPARIHEVGGRFSYFIEDEIHRSMKRMIKSPQFKELIDEYSTRYIEKTLRHLMRGDD